MRESVTTPPQQDQWLPPRPAPLGASWRQNALWIGVAVAAVACLMLVGWAFLSEESADSNGHDFVEALEREADQLAPPVLLSRLATFDWDHVSVIPPYMSDSRMARELVGDDASDLPKTSEDELVLVFITAHRLAGWAKLDARTDSRIGLSTRCLYNYDPLPRSTTYITVKNNRTYFSSRTGQPRTGTPYRGCVLAAR